MLNTMLAKNLLEASNKQLAAVIDQFADERAYLKDPIKARFECGYIAPVFNDALRAAGISGAMQISIPAFMLPELYGSRVNATHYSHVATLLNNTIYDWTARQYSPQCPFPLVYKLRDLPKEAQRYIDDRRV